MAKGKKVHITFWERAVWWCSVVGSVIIIAAAIPAMPWRYTRVDTNCGNRFVMERYYFLTGLTNNVGKTEGWMTMRRKMQRKTEEFGRPSPLTAIIGTVATSVGAGGAAAGCPMWMICKEHVNMRFTAYTTVAYSSFAFIGSAVLQAAFSAGMCVYLGFEQDARVKGTKKKKKKDDECMDMSQKTFTFALLAFLFALINVAGFVIVTLDMFNRFKLSAYYPFAGCHMAPFAGGLGCILLFVSCFWTGNRAYHCCDKKEPEHGEWGGEWAGYGGGGGYGYGKGGGYGEQQW